MKNIAIVISILLIASCSTDPGYIIKGTVQNDYKGMVVLKKQVGYSYQVIDSTFVEDNSFEFKGVVEIPDVYGLSLVGQKETQRFCLENADYQVEIGESVKESVIQGGSYQELMTTFNEEMGLLDLGERDLIKTIWRDTSTTQTQKDSLYPILEKLRKNKKILANSYIENNSGSPHAPMVLDIYIRNFLTVDQLDSVYQIFTDEAKMSNTGSKIGKSIKAIRRSAIGKPMIDFTMPGVNGEEIKLSEIVANNKLVFIDFWASWCGPCRASIPELKEIYNDYHEEGLEFLAVSYDDDRKKWLEAIENEGFEWINASNVVGWDCPTASDYAIRGIPASVLISKDGIIEGRSLRGQVLREKIEELLGE